MKAVHTTTRSQLSRTELLKQAKESEAAGDLKEAGTHYREVLKMDPHNEPAYSRLMIIYRKQKELQKELQLITKAIRSFEDMYASSNKTSKNKKVSRLSSALLRITGLADNKGRPVYEPEPLAKWKRRKDILDRKLKKL